MAQVSAQLNNLRIAPRKVRAVANLIKGKNVEEASHQLEVLVKRSSPQLTKLLNAAIANAENNFNMVKSNLFIKNLIVNEGVKLLRFKPKGFGRVSPIQKKTSLITMVLEEKIPGMKRNTAGRDTAPKEANTPRTSDVSPDIQTNKPAGSEARQGRPEIKKELGKKDSGLRNLGRKIFRRKAI